MRLQGIDLTEECLMMEEVARRIRVSPRTIRRYVRDKGLPAVKIGTRYYFFTVEVDAWIQRQRLNNRSS